MRHKKQPIISIGSLETEHPYHDVKIRVTILDTLTGRCETDSRWNTYHWTEGNGSCDCNRQLLFDAGHNPDCVSIRYRVIDVEPLLPGYSLEDFNEGYPDAMDYLDPDATWKYISEYNLEQTGPLTEATRIGG